MPATKLEPLDVTVPEAARLLSMGETTIWRLVASGELESYQIGKSRRVTLAGIRAFRERRIKKEKELGKASSD
jgi:excisionase family DNA binding protein